MTAGEFGSIYERLPVAFLLVTRRGRIEAVNSRAAELLGCSRRDLIGQSLQDRLSDEPERVLRYLARSGESLDFLTGSMQLIVHGSAVDLRTSAASAARGSEHILLHLLREEAHDTFAALKEKIRQLAVEIEESRRTEALITSQNEILGMIAEDARLADILDTLSGMVDACGGPEVIGSILLKHGDGTLQTGAAPGLPGEWNHAVDSAALQLDPATGEAGPFSSEPLICADISTDPRWFPFRDLALSCDLRACWSFPICSGVGDLLGIAAFYCRAPRAPLERERQLSRIVTSTASIAIERHRGNEQLAGILMRQSAMLDGLPASIALIDKTGRIRSVNSTWISWMMEGGLSVPEFGPGADLLASGGAMFDAPICDAIRSVIDGSSAQIDMERSWRNGDDPRWFRLSVAPVTTGGIAPRDVILMHLEVTDRKRAEEHLLSQTAELTRANAELQQFTYVASHDLREPLRTVKSFSQLFVRRYRGMLGDDADQFLTYIADGVSRMEDLIDDLLMYSRVAHGERDEQAGPAPLAEVIAAALRNLDAAITESGARICIGYLPVVSGNRTQLIQLFQNLINNAIKYRGNEQPLLEIRANTTAAGWEISVADNGIGIPRQYHETIFGLFKRLHSRTVPGTGIGLALCRRIAEAHGGSVRVESAPGKGSTFHVMLANYSRQASLAG